MYYTAHTPEGDSTLCDRCALLALNMAALDYFRRPFGSVEEGLVEINERIARSPVAMEPLTLGSSPYGVCGKCGEDRLAPVSA